MWKERISVTLMLWRAHLTSLRPGSFVRLAGFGLGLALVVSFAAIGFSALFRPVLPGGSVSDSAAYPADREEFRRKALALSRLPNLTVAEYTVKPGDNFWRIGREFGVDVHTVVGANPWLRDFSAAVGQVLLVPDRKGVLHEARIGETISSLAEFYGLEEERIIAENGGRRAFLGRLRPGRILFVPDVLPKMVSERIAAYYARRKIFVSPMAGAYTSGFGWRIHPVTRRRTFHAGLDLRARSGTPVHAAGGGVVTAAHEMSGYGHTVIIAHADGLTTLYAHNSRLLVRAGQRVGKGQMIARSGQSGTATGPHLHFEVRKNGKPEDPALYLW